MEENVEPIISVTTNGPYLVRGAVPISREEITVDDAGESVAWTKLETFPEKGTCALCRCGSSDSKPYCDGSHMVVGFDGAETATHAPYDETAATIEGPRLLVRDDVALCAEARFCAAKGAIWHRLQDDDDESRDIVVEEARLCPSGRYTVVDPSTGATLEPELEPSVAIVEDPSQGISGPLWVRGGVPVIAADGTPYEVRNRVTLCRCGSSKNRPFCDSTHVDIGFSDAD